MARVADPKLSEQRRQQILAAAKACFQRAGFHKTGMQAICAEAGLSAGAVYRYFGSKDELIAAIVESRRLGALALAFASKEVSFKGALSTLGRSAIDDAIAHGGALFGEVIAEVSRNHHLADRLALVERALEQELEKHFEKERRDRRFLSLDPNRAARTVGTFLNGLVLRVAVKGEHARAQALQDWEDFVERLVDAPKTKRRQEVAMASQEN
jgi:TetR/AcrR family transcriptional regulator, repressor for uid operon